MLINFTESVSVALLRASTLSNAVSSLANTGISFTKVDEREKQAALEEEQARLKALKVHFTYMSLFQLQFKPELQCLVAFSDI